MQAGHSFASWPYRTVQEVLNSALESVVGSKVNTVVAGRTDAGVHAIENIVHVDISRVPKSPKHPTPAPFGAETLKLALNGALKSQPGLVITKVELVDDSFHARFSATDRTYQYRLTSGADAYGRPFEGHGRWFIRNSLNIENMKAACAVMEGHHDFSAFRSSSDPSTPIRTMRLVNVACEAATEFPFSKRATRADLIPQHYTVTVAAKSFMTHQVRKMVATIVECGRGRLTVQQVREILESKSPAKCPSMASPHGLFLTNIEYPAHEIYDSTDPLAVIIPAR
jgi:tRNA pseudouridine38-40 synthase